MTRPWRPAALYVLVVAASLAAFLAWTEFGLLPDLERRTAVQLARTLAAMDEAIGDRPLSDSLADRLGAAAGVRLTFIGADGTILGDSEVPEGRLPSLADHDDRPEVREARDGGLGYERRRSRTVALSLFYVAARRGDSVLRVAIPESELTSPVRRIRRSAGLLAAVALGLLLVLGRYLGLARPRGLGELAVTARQLGRGRYDVRAPQTGALAELGAALNEAAGGLASREAGLRARMA